MRNGEATTSHGNPTEGNGHPTDPAIGRGAGDRAEPEHWTLPRFPKPDPSELPIDGAPLPLARAIERALAGDDGQQRIWRFRSEFFWWDGKVCRKPEEEAIRGLVWQWCDRRNVYTPGGAGMMTAEKRKVDGIIDALRSAVCSCPVGAMPAWIDGRASPRPGDVLAFPNGLLDVHQYMNDDGPILLRPTPLWFSLNVLPFKFDANARCPAFLKFLDEALSKDLQCIQLLQEWFGYCLVTDTRFQKILLIVGPKRSGKGTIGRVLARLVGKDNVCAPTLGSLTTNFGLQSLLGKLLALISDARLSGRADQSVVVERLLAISGEDPIDVSRKYLGEVTTQIGVRVVILTNELPRLVDASEAIADRFVVIELRNSYLGREDVALTEKLCEELPGILLWALEGLDRLYKRGHFVQPGSSENAINELKDLGSPVAAFVREWCDPKEGAEIGSKTLFEAWCVWCHEQGRNRPGTQPVFGRDLRAAVRGIAMEQPRTEGGGRCRRYTGIRLSDYGQSEFLRAKMERVGTQSQHPVASHDKPEDYI